jgi:hypothetical protein
MSKSEISPNRHYLAPGKPAGLGPSSLERECFACRALPEGILGIRGSTPIRPQGSLPDFRGKSASPAPCNSRSGPGDRGGAAFLPHRSAQGFPAFRRGRRPPGGHRYPRLTLKTRPIRHSPTQYLDSCPFTGHPILLTSRIKPLFGRHVTCTLWREFAGEISPSARCSIACRAALGKIPVGGVPTNTSGTTQKQSSLCRSFTLRNRKEMSIQTKNRC